MHVVDLFAGVGGFSFGARQANAEVALAIEADPHVAQTYRANHGDHVRVETLGGDVEALAAELGRLGKLHLHGSPPCQRLSRVNQRSRDVSGGSELVQWYLDLVARVRPATWSMEQVAHPAVKALLLERRLPFTVVNTMDFGVPQSRVRLIAGSPRIVAALEARKGSGPTLLPMDVLPSLQPVENFLLTSGTTNQPVRAMRDGVRVTVGLRRMDPGEGGRDLHTPCHTVWSRKGSVYDRAKDRVVRELTLSECAALQGFPADVRLCERSACRSLKMIANALPPPLARTIAEAAMGNA